MMRLFYLKSKNYLIRTLLFTVLVVTSCGVPRSSDGHLAIIGGHPVAPNEYPEVVAFMRDELTLCTGTLIDADLVLTAAHCFEKTLNAGSASLGTMRVVAGSKSTKPGPLLTSAIVEAKIHSRYWKDHRGALDFAWVRIDPPMASIPPASLPIDRDELDAALLHNQSAVIVGFGVSSTNARDTSPILGIKNMAEVPITTRTGVELFAGSSTADTCSGDSGGPLYLNAPSNRRTPSGRLLVGVTSRGPSPCAADFDQGVYGLTSEAICWLRSTAKWQRDDQRLLDFCVRETARSVFPAIDPIVNRKPFKEACLSNELGEAARHDLRTLLRIAGTNDAANESSCALVENFLSNATILDISNTQFRQLAWLQSANNLQTLTAHDNLIADITPLINLKELSLLDLRNNTISEIEPLQSLSATVKVFGLSTQWSNIDDTRYRKLAELGAALSREKRALVIALREILVVGSIERKSRDLALKRQIILDNRGVRSLEALHGLENLEALSLMNNPDILDWEELLTLPRLKVLRLSTQNSLPDDIAEQLSKRGVTIEKR